MVQGDVVHWRSDRGIALSQREREQVVAGEGRKTKLANAAQGGLFEEGEA